MNWAAAYARQAKSDLDAREQLLRDDRPPACHQLHFLQMAAEKLCKAHLSARGQPQDVLEASHAFVAGPLPVIVRQIIARDAQRLQRDTWVLKAVRKLCRQIELLHPQVDDNQRVPSNAVYPWRGPDGHVIAPRDHPFELTLLREKAGATLLKIMTAVADELIAEA
jgi:hypothetical protein